ncbi:MAG TPA: thioesterase family protein [Flavisolibacter sp.]
MARVRVELPAHFPFSTAITVRITDLNYGNHAGNDAILAFFHEARVRFLEQRSLKELSFMGVSLIMRDVIIEYKAEVFYGDELTIEVAACGFTGVGFDLCYRMMKSATGQVAAVARTGMVCYNYESRKVARLPEGARSRLEG